MREGITAAQCSLRALLDGAPCCSSVCHKTEGAIQAVVTTTKSGYWARLYADDPAVEGNRLRSDVAGLVALLAEAGIAVESGWEPWQARAR